MRRLPRPRDWAGLLALVLLSSPAAAQPLTPGQAVPLEAREGRCDFVLPTDRPDAKFYVIVGSLDHGAQPHRVAVRTEATSDPVSLPRADTDPGPAWRRQVAEVADRLDRARRERTPGEEYPPLADPPRQRVFHLFVGEH